MVGKTTKQAIRKARSTIVMKAALWEEIGLHYDADEIVSEGDYLQTRTGRCYKVLKVRIQMKGFWKGRYHLRCMVVQEPEKDCVIHELVWYPRD